MSQLRDIPHLLRVGDDNHNLDQNQRFLNQAVTCAKFFVLRWHLEHGTTWMEPQTLKMATGPRRIVSFEDGRGERIIMVNMAYGLSVKLSITPTGETIIYIDREGEEDTQEAATSYAALRIATNDQTDSSPVSPPKQDGEPKGQVEPPKRGRGRPRLHPIAPPAPGKLGEFKEGLELAHRR